MGGCSMKAKTFEQASYQWACYIYDNFGRSNEHSYPSEKDSEEKHTVWILKNHFGVLAVIDKVTGKVIT